MGIAIFLHEDAHSVGFDVSGFDLAKAPAMGLQHMRDCIGLLGGSALDRLASRGWHRPLGSDLAPVTAPGGSLVRLRVRAVRLASTA